MNRNLQEMQSKVEYENDYNYEVIVQMWYE